MLALAGVIFVIALVRIADDFVMKLGGSSDFVWSEGSTLGPEETYRLVYDTLAVVDIDFVLFMMLIGSIGIAAATLWGVLKLGIGQDPGDQG